MDKLFAGFIESSRDPKQLSLLIKAQLLLVAPIAALIINAAGGHVLEGDLQTLAERIAEAIDLLGTGAWALVSAWAIVRKTWLSLKK